MDEYLLFIDIAFLSFDGYKIHPQLKMNLKAKHNFANLLLILSQEPSQSHPYTLYGSLCPDTIFHPVRLL